MLFVRIRINQLLIKFSSCDFLNSDSCVSFFCLFWFKLFLGLSFLLGLSCLFGFKLIVARPI